MLWGRDSCKRREKKKKKKKEHENENKGNREEPTRLRGRRKRAKGKGKWKGKGLEDILPNFLGCLTISAMNVCVPGALEQPQIGYAPTCRPCPREKQLGPVSQRVSGSVPKLEVFNDLQMSFGHSKCTYLRATFQTTTLN